VLPCLVDGAGNCPFNLFNPFLIQIMSSGRSVRLTNPTASTDATTGETTVKRWDQMSNEQRTALTNSKRVYCAALKAMVYARLKQTCDCGSRDRLRLRFRDPKHPLKHAFTRHHETLHAKMLKDPEFFEELALTCGACRIKLHYAAKA
jgi:hypothetical protein